ncbi:MAG: 3' terminal RNA ribose 2'-O-methyltransferase Hen1 [Spirochaetes bacterium]|nr:3' terminal RNA ribose 2'-O-methyltransferase Hen1 [Spirochaetota bacterium]
MLLTITYTGEETQNLGYLLHKNPYRPQAFDLNHGKAYVFYTEISHERTTAALLLDINPVDLARGKADSGAAGAGGLFDYVNDRPYASSSFMSTAISKVFGTALSGRADSRQALSDSPLDLSASVTMLPCRDTEKLNAVFQPLGYAIRYETFSADDSFARWGDSKYVNLEIAGKVRLRDLLKHLYVLIPVFDMQKHYWVGEDEVDKLLRHGEDWLAGHPEKEYITRQYLHRHRRLVDMAIERLTGEAAERPAKNLNARRLAGIVQTLKERGVKSVIDLGCGEGNLLQLLVKERQFAYIAGVDVSYSTLRRADEKLHLEQAAGSALSQRLKLIQGSLMYRDERFSGYDAACVIEVIEHLDTARLAAFERVLFQFAKPPLVVITTPNKEYNAHYAKLDGDLRHYDHRFEWTRREFSDWAARTAEKFGYSVALSQIGDADETCGAPTQMGVFSL